MGYGEGWGIGRGSKRGFRGKEGLREEEGGRRSIVNSARMRLCRGQKLSFRVATRGTLGGRWELDVVWAVLEGTSNSTEP